MKLDETGAALAGDMGVLVSKMRIRSKPTFKLP